MNALDTAILATLQGDATLAALASDGIHNGFPRQNATQDLLERYVEFGEETGADVYAWSRRVAIPLIYRVKAVARADASKAALEAAKEMRERADVVLTDGALVVAGFRVGERRRYGVFSYEELADGVVYAHAGMRYRVRLFPV
jgi:hypothetical protein